MRLIADEPGQGPVDVPQLLFMNDGQPGKIHDQKKKKHLPLVSLIAVLARI